MLEVQGGAKLSHLDQTQQMCVLVNATVVLRPVTTTWLAWQDINEPSGAIAVFSVRIPVATNVFVWSQWTDVHERHFTGPLSEATWTTARPFLAENTEKRYPASLEGISTAVKTRKNVFHFSKNDFWKYLKLCKTSVKSLMQDVLHNLTVCCFAFRTSVFICMLPYQQPGRNKSKHDKIIDLQSGYTFRRAMQTIYLGKALRRMWSKTST